MGDFNRRRDSRGFGGRRSFGGNREMHTATCSACQKECQVPFKPTGARPVYCSECYTKNGGGRDTRRSSGFDDRNERPNFRKFNDAPREFQSNSQLDTINSKLDQILRLLQSAPKTQEPKAEKTEVDVKKASKKAKKVETPKEEKTSLPQVEE
jgi:CxxC-x17-CxxC domain-containing protein